MRELGIREEQERKGKRSKEYTLLYPSLLTLIHNELLEFLLVSVGQLGEVKAVCGDGG